MSLDISVQYLDWEMLGGMEKSGFLKERRANVRGEKRM